MKSLDFRLPAAIEVDGFFLTDHNRSPIQVSNRRIVNDIRTQFGDLRRYYQSDKRAISLSWNMLPQSSSMTVDRNLGAEDMIGLFRDTTGDVEVNIYYTEDEYESVRCVILEFSYSILKRWDEYRFYEISMSLEEV